jgi:hypothetical protein
LSSRSRKKRRETENEDEEDDRAAGIGGERKASRLTSAAAYRDSRSTRLRKFNRPFDIRYPRPVGQGASERIP